MGPRVTEAARLNLAYMICNSPVWRLWWGIQPAIQHGPPIDQEIVGHLVEFRRKRVELLDALGYVIANRRVWIGHRRDVLAFELHLADVLVGDHGAILLWTNSRSVLC